MLPNRANGLRALENSVTSSQLLDLILDMRMANTKLDVALPKFSLRTSLNLKEALAGLGLTDLFDPRQADLTAISADKALYVTDAFHQSFIQVNEEGTEAATATGWTVINFY